MTLRRLWPAFVLAVALALPGAVAHAAPGPVMYPRGVGADLGPAPATLGLAVAAGDPAGPRTGTIDGRGFWTAGSIVLTPDAAYAAGVADRPIVAVVTYHDDGSGRLLLGARTVAELTGTGAWRLAAVGLDGADLAGDLRLSGDGADITIAQVRITASGPGATLGPAATDTGLSPRAGDNEAGLVTGTAAGRGFWRTDAAAGTGYLYFNVADAYAYDTRDIVLVSVDYLDTGNGTLYLHYDSPGTTIPDMFKASPAVTYGDTGQWRTHDFVLDDAILTNRSNGADFRLTHDGSPAELTIAAVRVTVVPRQLDAKAGLRDLVKAADLALYAAREGTREGQYPPGAKAALAAVAARARAVLDDPAATEAAVRAALQELFDADRAFRAAAVNTDLARAAAWTSGSGPDGEWRRADLGAARPVDEVLVRWGAVYSPDYRVELSTDGATYTAVGRNGAGGGGSSSRTRFPKATARYVRLVLGGAGHVDVAAVEIRDARTAEPSPRLVTTRFPTADAVVADFDAASYGADPTGRRDATSALQAALWDCYDAGGGTVWLPDGTYRVTGTVEVPAFCTLRGDRRDPDRDPGRDPDHGGGPYGTLVVADLPAGDAGPVLFRIGGSAGVMGVTTWYPRQDAAAPVPYNFTFEIPGSAWAGDENYMMSTVADVTMLNSYRGIGVSTMRDERGRPPGNGQTHESATVRGVRGTALLEGVEAYNGADVGTWEDVRFSNEYWAQAPPALHPPRRAEVDAWTRAHGTGFVLGDLEWDQFTGLSAADYHIGIHVVAGLRAEFTGVFAGTRIDRTDVALQVDKFDDRWGLAMAGGELDGRVVNHGGGYVKLTGTRVTGAVEGTVYRMDGPPPAATAATTPIRPARPVLYDAKAPHGNGYLPAADATAAIQRALDRAGRDGGGVVYLAAGWYRLAGRLSVPAGVELRGASSVPNRDEDGRSGGTVLLAYAGRGDEDGPATVTLRGDRAGVNGLRVFHPENNPAAPGGLVPYPYVVRGQGDGQYVVNVGLPNAWNAVELTGDRFLVRKLKGTFVRHGVTAGRGTGGRVEGVLSNGNTFVRTGFYPPDWVLGANLFPQVIDAWTRTHADLVTVDGARRLTVAGAFGYGLHNGLVVNAGDVTVVNLGTDNLGGDGCTVRVTGGRAAVVNLMRYNGATSSGAVPVYNIMVINIAEHPVSVTASPPGAGTVRLSGNETRPGYYEQGSTVTASARPARGMRFAGWSDGSAEREHAVTVTGPLALTAQFVPEAT